jgi:glycosyltransferase involved in cell wall biosynthesis
MSNEYLSNSDSKDLLSIGLPVYNCEEYISKAIESVLDQELSNFEIIISDNASTDNTGNICKKYEKISRNISYTRQDTNIGAIENFKFVLNKSKGEYFIWLASDDMFFNINFKKAIALLKNNRSISAVSFKSVFLTSKGDVEDRCNEGLLGSVCNRLLRLALNPGANSRFYSLYRLKDISLVFNSRNFDFFGSDVIVSFMVAKMGKWVHFPDSTMHRRLGSSSNPIKLRKNYGMSKLNIIFPSPKYLILIAKNIAFPCIVVCAPALILLYIRVIISPIKHYLTNLK